MHRLLPIIVVLFVSATTAHAALTTAGCLAQKQKAWGGLRKCEAEARAKLLQAKPADFAKCQTKFADKLGKISDKAASASVACRYGDNGDGTVTDYDTGLQWEKKVSPGGGATDPHDVDNKYTWNTSGADETIPDGTVFTDFLGKLNAVTSPNGTTQIGGFAGHYDWRLPTSAELQTIVDFTEGNCDGGSGPCIGPIFGPTFASGYWSFSTFDSEYAFILPFDTGDFTIIDFKSSLHYVRAVRTAS